MFTIKVLGLTESVAYCNTFPTKYDTQRQAAHNRIADQGVKAYSSRAHVITGKLRNSIQKGKVDKNSVEIITTVKYAFAENARGSAHAFIKDGDKELDSIIQKEEDAAATAAMSGR